MDHWGQQDHGGLLQGTGEWQNNIVGLLNSLGIAVLIISMLGP